MPPRRALVPALLLLLPALAAAQEAEVSFRAAPSGMGMALPLFSLGAPAPATNRGAMLPALTLTNGDNGPEVQNLLVTFPDISLGGVAVHSRLGDQPLPAMFRSSSLAGSSLASPVRGLSLTTGGSTPVNLMMGQMADYGSGAGAPSIMALGMTLAPSARVSVAPQVIVPVGAPDAQTGISTAIRTQLVSGVAVVTDLGAARTGELGWAPSASARLVGRWAHAGLETGVIRGVASPESGDAAAVVGSRDLEIARGHVQPLPDLTFSARTSWSRPASDADSPDTTAGAFGVTYAGLPHGQVAAVHERQVSASWESETTSLEWRQEGPNGVNVRYRQKRESDAAAGAGEVSSRVEVDLPALAPRQMGNRLQLRAALAAGAPTEADPGFSSRLSGRIDLLDDVALAGSTELGLAGGGQTLREFRLTTDVAVRQDTGLQLLYTYRAGPQTWFGQAFEARISRRINLGF